MIASSKRYISVMAAVALVAVAVSACGGGGGGEPTTTDTSTPVDLGPVSDGFMAEAGTLEIEAGGSAVHGDIAFACAADGDACTVVVAVDADGETSLPRP